MKSKRSKACDILPSIRQIVKERDSGCIVCGRYQTQVAHYIPRSQGGLGIEKNLVLLCPRCHMEFDNGSKRKEIGEFVRNYLRSKYDDWNEDDLIYNKWRNE